MADDTHNALTRADAPTPPMVLHREMEMVVESPLPTEERAADSPDGVIRIAMSSEVPVLRYDWWTGEKYFEVLDHGPDGPDLGYARDGLPFLKDHDSRAQIGLVEQVKRDGDRKIRGVVRMGSHPDAPWIEQDMRAGIRKKVSIGYDPGATYEVVSAKDDKVPTRRYRGWRLYEASTVAVPADYDVGVMRDAFERSAPRPSQSALTPTSREAKETTMDGTQNTPAPAHGAAGQNGNAGIGVTRDHDAERKERNAAIANIAKLAQSAGVQATAEEALRNDWTPEQFAQVVSERSIERAKAPVPAGRVEMSEKEKREYSIVRVMNEIADAGLRKRPIEPGLELEISTDIAKEMGRAPKGIFVPLNLGTDRVAAAAVRNRLGLESRAAVTGNVAGTASLGGAGVETSVQSLIEILRNSSVLRQMGIRSIDGLTGNVLFPRQITANTWSWEGENPSTAKALTAATFDSFTLSPKTGYGATAYSKQLLVQSSYSVEQFVREDLAQIAAIGIDLAGIHGLGTSNQPTGVFVLSNTGSVTIGSNGGPLTWAKVVEFEKTAEVANALQGRLAYLSTPGVRYQLKTTLKNTVAGADYLIADSGQLNTYPTYFTNQVKTNFTKGTSTTVCHGMAFGNWAEGFMGTWGDALDITVDPYTYVTQGVVQVVESAMVDFGWRHPASFVICSDITVS